VSTGARPSRALSVALLCVKLLLAAVFLLAGGLKIYGLPRLVAEFQQIGVGDWFRHATGLLEIIGAVALLVPGFAAAGAALLACIMIAASAVHLFILGDSPLAAAILLGLSLLIFFTHLNDLASLRTRFRLANAAPPR
jgi:putative oxidoreductase